MLFWYNYPEPWNQGKGATERPPHHVLLGTEHHDAQQDR